MGRRYDNAAAQVVLANVGPYELRWSHEEGGNVINHAGSAVWLPNVRWISHQLAGWPSPWYIAYSRGWTGPHSLDTFHKNR